MKYLSLCLFLLSFGLLAKGGETDKKSTEKDHLTFKVELYYLSPVWRVRWKGQGLGTVKVSQDMGRYLEKLDPEFEYKCYAYGYSKGVHQSQGFRLEKLDRCRQIWKN